MWAISKNLIASYVFIYLDFRYFEKEVMSLGNFEKKVSSSLNLLVHGPESEIIPPGGIFVDPYIFVVWALVFKNLVVGC